MTPRSAFLLLALALLVVACGGGGGDTTTTAPTAGEITTDESTTTAAPSETTTTVAETTTTAPEPTTTTAAPTTTTAAASAACLVGDWVVTGESMQAFYDGISAENDGLSFDVSGVARISFTETTYQWRPDFTLDVEIAAGMSGTGNVTGTIDGNYTAVDGILTTSSDDNALEMTVTVGGTTVETDGANALLDSSPVNDAAFECGPSGPIIHFKTSSSTVAVPLDPA